MVGFPSLAADGAADHLCPGTALPPAVLPATDGSDICLARLRERTVIAVYPWTGRPGYANPPGWDDIPGAHGSTPELEGFRDAASRFAAAAVGLLALSRQTTNYQQELGARLGLPFPLLSDADGVFTTALALPTFTTGGDIYLKRLTLVAAEGRLERIFYPVSDPAGHASEVLAAIA